MIDELIDEIREEIVGREEGITVCHIGLLRASLDITRISNGKDGENDLTLIGDRGKLIDELLEKIKKEITEREGGIKASHIEALVHLLVVIRNYNRKNL